MPRRCLVCVVLLAAALHAAGIARTLLPAQDGLKFLRVAREFHAQPWADVVRSSDQHPLYSALIALVQPGVAAVRGHGPEAWRIAAQGVSALASIALILPLFGLARALFDERTALLASLLWVLLPIPAEVGRDTLSDPLALLLFTTALWLGERTIRTRSTASGVACGIAAGVGFLARPEVAVVPIAVAATVFVRGIVAVGPDLAARVSRSVQPWKQGHGGPKSGQQPHAEGDAGPPEVGPTGPGKIGLIAEATGRPRPCYAALAVAFLAVVGAFAIVKGEVSEKLALRHAASLPSRHDQQRRVAHALPPGLDDPRWDFSPKEESDAPGRFSLPESAGLVLSGWAEGLAWAFAPIAVLGIFRVRAGAGGWLVAVYGLVFSAILVRHGMNLGYVSTRHTLTLVIATLPWAAAGTIAIGRRLDSWLPGKLRGSRAPQVVALAALVLAGVVLQSKSLHPSRWGHWAAGRWLAENASPGDAVLDTRGWAAFSSGCRGYDYWHVRQALTDARLAYLVVGRDELSARSARAATLKAMLAYACDFAAAFPAREEGSGQDVLVYRFHRPSSWRAIAP